MRIFASNFWQIWSNQQGFEIPLTPFPPQLAPTAELAAQRATPQYSEEQLLQLAVRNGETIEINGKSVRFQDFQAWNPKHPPSRATYLLESMKMGVGKATNQREQEKMCL